VVPEDRPDLKLTYEDLQAFPDDGKRHEIIDGEHFVTPSPETGHQAIAVNLVVLLKNFLDAHALGEVFVAPLDVVFSDTDVVEPDLLFVAAEHADRITRKNIRGAPDLVIEILSPSTRKTDEVIKRKLFERFGVAEYWVVDPELETVKVYRRAEKGFARVAELSKEAGEMLTTPLLPGFAAPLEKIFA
jgi:Uma2 family endonuclease